MSAEVYAQDVASPSWREVVSRILPDTAKPADISSLYFTRNTNTLLCGYQGGLQEYHEVTGSWTRAESLLPTPDDRGERDWADYEVKVIVGSEAGSLFAVTGSGEEDDELSTCESGDDAWHTVDTRVLVKAYMKETDREMHLHPDDVRYERVCGLSIRQVLVCDGTLLVEGSSLFRSTDKGATWRACRYGNRGGTIEASCLGLVGGHVILCGTKAAILRSTNGGREWSTTNLVLARHEQVESIVGNTRIALASITIGDTSEYHRYDCESMRGYLVVSTDAGSTWCKPHSQPSGTYNCGRVGAHILYADGAGDLYVRTNEGLFRVGQYSMTAIPEDSSRQSAGTAENSTPETTDKRECFGKWMMIRFVGTSATVYTPVPYESFIVVGEHTQGFMPTFASGQTGDETVPVEWDANGEGYTIGSVHYSVTLMTRKFVANGSVIEGSPPYLLIMSDSQDPVTNEQWGGVYMRPEAR